MPADMDPNDHAAFVELGRQMAALNLYTAKQASLLYPTNGDSDDWLYGERGIFAFTFEMYPRESYPGFYPPDSVIAAETARNRGAVSYLVAVSDSPLKVVGLGGDTTQPTVALELPTGGSHVSGSVEIRATAADAVGVTLVEFLADGETIGLDTSAPFAIVWDSTDAPGQHVLSARAFDHGHNVRVSDEVLVTVLTLIPTPSPSTTPSAINTTAPTHTVTTTPSPTPTASATHSLSPTPTASATASPTPTPHGGPAILMPLLFTNPS